MARTRRSRRFSYTALPADVVRRIFAGAGDPPWCKLSVEDRWMAPWGQPG